MSCKRHVAIYSRRILWDSEVIAFGDNTACVKRENRINEIFRNVLCSYQELDFRKALLLNSLSPNRSSGIWPLSVWSAKSSVTIKHCWCLNWYYRWQTLKLILTLQFTCTTNTTTTSTYRSNAHDISTAVST